ncbi:MAG: class I SAM-dependent methyltransferase [Anaerolineales bacterium]
MSDVSLRTYYEEIYHDHMMPEQEDVARNEWVLDQRAHHLAAFAREHIQDVSTLLDVGSSRGHVLAVFQSQYRADGYAVEPGSEVQPDVARHARQVVSELNELPEYLRGEIDLAVLSHVLEHFPDPLGFLRRLRRSWLQSDGWVLIEVPNLIWHSALELSHLTAFTADSLRNMIEAAGYRFHQLKLHGRPYSHRFPLFLLALAKPEAEPAGSGSLSQPPPTWWLRWTRCLARKILQITQRALQIFMKPFRFKPWSS